MPLIPYLLLAKIGAVLALVGALSFGMFLYNEHFRDIGRAEVRAEWDAAEAKAKIAADKQEATWNKRLEEANANFTKRQEANQLALVAANTAVNGLSGSLTRIRSSVSSNPASASANAAIALSLANVFGDCGSKYKEMGENADRWANATKTLIEAWPKNEVAKP